MGTVSKEDVKLAQKVQETYGVPASVVLGQKIQETGWDESTVGKNNYFNIKGSGTGGYRDYKSKEESFMDYGKLLSGERYTKETQTAQNVEEYVQGIKNAGYAEDPNYVTNVLNVIEDNDLTKYDKVSLTSGYDTSETDLKWWGDVVIIVVAILLIIMGVVFVGLAVTNNSISEVLKDPTKIIKKVVTK